LSAESSSNPHSEGAETVVGLLPANCKVVLLMIVMRSSKLALELDYTTLDHLQVLVSWYLIWYLISPFRSQRTFYRLPPLLLFFVAKRQFHIQIYRETSFSSSLPAGPGLSSHLHKSIATHFSSTIAESQAVCLQESHIITLQCNWQ
jgi:hypothetical protein